MQILRGPTPSSLFLPIVTLLLASSRWTILTKKLKYRRNCQERSSKQATEAGQNFSVQTTSKLDRRFARSYRKVTTYRTLARRLFELCIAWDVATCCQELITCRSHMQACSFRPPTSMTLYASGVRELQNQRRIQGLQVQTPRRPPTSEFTL